MSRSKSKRSAPKHQRVKLATLPFLLAVLGYALFGGSEPADDKPAAMQSAAMTVSTRPNLPRATAGQRRAEEKADLPAWSELAAAHRGKSNPFLPMVKEEEEEESPPPMPTELQPPAPTSTEVEVALTEESPAEADDQPDAAAVEMAALAQQPVRYFFQTNDRRVMLVGDQLLSEGQTLKSFTVTRLAPNRIELEPSDAQHTEP